jgi:hypothetical protein
VTYIQAGLGHPYNGGYPDFDLALGEMVNRPERRHSRRFPIELAAELHAGRDRISGRTANISSGGLLMICSHQQLEVGKRVKVRITNWPGAPRKKTKVVLIVEGFIVRMSSTYVAVRRTRYEFAAV